MHHLESQGIRHDSTPSRSKVDTSQVSLLDLSRMVKTLQFHDLQDLLADQTINLQRPETIQKNKGTCSMNKATEGWSRMVFAFC